MGKIYALLLSVLIGFTGLSLAETTNKEIPVYAQAANSSYEELSIALLHPHIEKALTEY